jgi:hypothetical protein
VGTASGTSIPLKLLLAAPRGFCAGVVRAIEAVERALDLYGPPVYVRHEIVHNRHVLDRLVRCGAIFVEDEKDIPEGARIVFSAHGVSPRVRSSGIIPVDDILGEGWFLGDVQAHYATDAELVEGGQLFALHIPPGRTG